MYSILYVDDEPGLLEVGKLFLEQGGEFSVDTVTAASAAMDLMNKQKYDAIVADYQMPEMDGIEFLKKVRSSGNTIPFILFTGRGREQVVIQALNEGADFYLQKGGDPASQYAELSNKIRYAITRRNAEAGLEKRERQLKAMAANIPGVVYRISVNPDGTHGFDYISKRSLQILGLEQDTAHFLDRFTQGIVAEDRERFTESMRHAVSTKTLWEYSGWYVKPSGKKIWISGVSNPVMEHDRLVFDGVIFDSTSWKLAEVERDRKTEELKASYEQIEAADEELRTSLDEMIRKEQALRESEKLLRKDENQLKRAEEVGRSGSWEFRLNENTVDASEGARRLYGIGESAWTIDAVQKIPLPEYRPLLDTALKDLIAGKSPYNIEFRIKRPSDQTILDLHSVAEYDPVRNVVVGVIHDITQRKRAEEELRTAHSQITASAEELRSQYEELAQNERLIRKSEAYYQSILAAIPDGVALTDLQGTVNLVSPAVLKIFGFGHENEILGKSIVLFLVPEDQGRAGENIALMHQGIFTGPGEYRAFRADGSIFSIVANADFVRDAEGKHTGMVFIVHDITKRKQMEEALQEKTSQIQTLVDNLPFDVWAMDQSGKYILQNPASIRHWGKSIGKDPGEIPLPPDVFEHWTENNRKAFEGNVVRREVSIARGDGVRTYDEIIAPVRTGNEIKGIIGTNIDITERKQAEEELRKSEDRYRSLIETTGTGYVILDRDGRVITANEEYVRLTGRSSRAEIEGKSVIEWTASYDRERNALELENCFRKGQVRGLEIDYQKPDGSIQPLEINASLVTSGTTQIILTLCRDISYRKNAEDAIKNVNHQLKLLSSITRHDIQNQLTMLRGYLAVLEKDPLASQYKEYSKKAEKAAESISGMIQFSKEYDAIGVNIPVWQNIHTLVETAGTQASPGKGTVKNDLPAGTEVFADPLIVKVFYNLIDNAVKHGGNVTSVRFLIEERDGEHIIICEDDGCGIPPENKELIFTRGFGKNTGLGLFLSREILLITGITIAETGKHGNGARFEMNVPRRAFRS
ncbi:MAG: PAS domain S-box protein [Methanoregula sp.]